MKKIFLLSLFFQCLFAEDKLFNLIGVKSLEKYILFFGVFIVVLIISIIIYKIVLERKKSKALINSKKIKEEVQKVIENKKYIKNKISTPKTKMDFFSLTNASIEALKESREDETKELLYNLLEDKEVISYLKDLIRNKTSISRLESVEKMGLLFYERNKYFLFSILENEKEKSRMYFHTLIALSYIIRRDDLKFFLEEVVRVRSNSGKYLEFLFTNVIKRMVEIGEQDTAIDIVYFLYQIDDNEKLLKSFLDAVGYLKINYINDEIFDLYFMTNNIGLKTTVVRTIGQLNANEKFDDVILFAIESDNEIIRIAASKNMNIFNIEKHREKLKKAIFDKNYNVRLNAAIALSKKEEGIKILKEIYLESSDNYARETAMYAIILNRRDYKNTPK